MPILELLANSIAIASTRFLLIPSLVGLASCSAGAATSGGALSEGAQEALLPGWSPGYLDIHHIQTGRGNAAFVIMPDGTTMLVDAGALPDDWGAKYEPLKLAPAVPNNVRRPGEWIADYIAQFAPPTMTKLDYAIITHFHTDHYGEIQRSSPRSSKGDWKLAGLTDVAERWPVSIVIDRDYPSYSFPVSKREAPDPNFANYLAYIEANVAAEEIRAEQLNVGRDDQIVCQLDKNECSEFSVRNIAANGNVWTGEGSAKMSLLSAAEIVNEDGKYNENPLSTVIKINYGKFDYVTGGDLTGINKPDQPDWFAIEEKIAPIVGEVDAMTLNHHGNRDATSAEWLEKLAPRVLVQQSWVSDHPGGEVVARIISRKIWPDDRDIFATYVHPETQIAIGPWLTHNYKSLRGHVVIRVHPGGGTYKVFVLNERDLMRKKLAEFGPYQSR